MTRKSLFWIAFIVISILCLYFSIRFFSAAFPIVSLNIELNRTDAQHAADSLSARHGWGPVDYRTAASFTHEHLVQNFIELEGGGKYAFTEMMRSGLYMPYIWKVRHYRYNETNETLVRFTPDGKFYGFEETMSEETPGPSLDVDSALALAESFAVQEFNINLDPFNRVETATKIQPSGRADHTFIYERKNESIGEGKYRLRLKVSGDRVSEITHFVKIPESFIRHYREMRSSNDTIANAALIAMIILYIIGGCVIGLYYLIHNHILSWRGPLFWALILSAAQAIERFNNLPLLWMDYDTALSLHGFLLEQVVTTILLFMGTCLAYIIIFITAEGLTRLAFPNQIQFWKLWSRDAANSPEVFKRTVSGFLFVPLFFAFEVALYLYANRLLGWWSPSDVLFEPDVLATYVPWFSSIAISLEAGFLEECLFRAIPIAGAVILARRFGYRRIIIPAAFLIQAIIFGAAHANYVQQPPYSRLIELIFPALGFGVIYYLWGLLPAIIMHFCYDVVWLAIPLIVSDASGIWINHVIIVLLVLVPLWVIVYYRLRSGRWVHVRESHLNRSWQMPLHQSVSDTAPSGPTYHPVAQNRRFFVVMISIGIIGLIAWFRFSNLNHVDPELNISRNEIKQRTIAVFNDRHIELDSSWTTLISTVKPLSDDDEFIWQAGGPQVYEELINSYISPPLWRSRIVKFHGDVIERAEEYHLYFNGVGQCVRFRHKIPEQWPGADLSRTDAEEIARRAIDEHFSLDTAKLHEVHASPRKQAHRTDWLFTYSDTLRYHLNEGEARVAVSICGDEVADLFRYIHVPEEWQREQRNSKNLFTQMIILGDIIIFILFTISLIGSIIIVKNKNFSVQVFLWSLVIIFVLSMLDLINRWPMIVADFSTAKPFYHQVFTSLAFPLIGNLFMASGPALIMGFMQSLKRNQPCKEKIKSALLAFLPGLMVAGMYAMISYFYEPSLKPLWSSSEVAGYLIPALGIALSHLPAYVVDTIIALLLFIAVDRFSGGWTRRKFLSALLFLITVFLIHGNNADTLNYWIILGLISSAVYFLLYIYIFRHQLALIPIFMSATVIMTMLREAFFNSYLHVRIGTLIGTAMILVLAFVWFMILCRDRDKLSLHKILADHINE